MATAAENLGAPDYLSELESAHQAHLAELRQIIGDLPIAAGHRILDMGCGDGAYIPLLAKEVGPMGTVIGVDASPECIDIARERLANSRAARIEFIAANVDALPFPEYSFDFVWCAKSLVSFAQPESAIGHMVRQLKSGGILAVMENDSLHEVSLPWPEELELSIRQAELDAYRDQVRRPDKRYIARWLQTLLCDAGLTHVQRRTYPIDRTAPISQAELAYLSRYLNRLREKVFPYLSSTDRSQFDKLAVPDSPDFLARTQGFGMTWYEVVCSGHSGFGNPQEPPK